MMRTVTQNTMIPFLPLFLAAFLLNGCAGPDSEKGNLPKGDGSSDTLAQEKEAAKEEGKMKEKVLKGAVPPSPKTIRKEFPGKKSYNSVEKRKMAFFEHLYPVVKAENERVKEEKTFLQDAFARFSSEDSLADSTLTHLKALAIKYRVDPDGIPSQRAFEELERKVDIIPEELALIQAANESNWGRSRFAKQGNNLFGQWCFTGGCGIVPKRRAAGSTHEVAAFPNVQFSVRSYIRNLNSHPAYKPLRVTRSEMRRKGKEPTAYALAGGLTKYAGIGHDYVKILRQMLRSNKKLLERTDAVAPLLSEGEQQGQERTSSS